MTCESLRQICPSNRWSERVHFLSSHKSTARHGVSMTKMWKILLLTVVFAWGSCVLMLLHSCADHALRNGSQICSKPVLFASMTHSPSERWRVLKLSSTGSKNRISCCVDVRFVDMCHVQVNAKKQASEVAQRAQSCWLRAKPCPQVVQNN